MIKDRFVVDTCALMSYFKEFFKIESSISEESLEIIENAFYYDSSNLIIPSTVFVEIFQKHYRNEELAAKLNIEIYQRIKSKDNMEIQPFDQEIMENFCDITDIESNHNFDNHDKQIFAAAITMNCPLITSDRRLLRYNNRKRLIPKILN